MQNTGQAKPAGQGPVGGAARRAKPEIPAEFKAEPIEKLDQTALIRILGEPGSEPATVFRKAIACKRLAVIGTKEAVPPLAALLGDDQVSDYARDALESMPDPAADEVLRAALPKLKGLPLIGAINSLRRRRDLKAVEPLGKLVYGADAAVARAAALAVGEISGPVAAKTLQRALGATKGAIRADVAAGALLCADRMMAEDRKGALALFDVLSRPDIPSNVRMAAMHLQIAAETSLKRPRTAPAQK
jgi:HEAT repeat protein